MTINYEVIDFMDIEVTLSAFKVFIECLCLLLCFQSIFINSLFMCFEILYYHLLQIPIFIIGFHHNPYAVYKDELTKKIIAIAIIVAAEAAFILLYDKVTVLPVELWQNRHLIWKLARNDFKKRYAGSYLGAVWAMVQPVVTVIMYYIVFDVIMGAGDQAGARETSIPYVLFLTAGLVPWFYFS